jgi:predicted metal-dependent RNase
MRFLALGGTTVGASCYLYELGTTRLLIDCGVQPGLMGAESLPQLELEKASLAKLKLVERPVRSSEDRV